MTYQPIKRGMTLRDWFAGQVCTALMTMTSADTDFPNLDYRRHPDGLPYAERVAHISYQMADAMLRARETSNAQQQGHFDRKRFERAPCYLCGYNGEGYYQPDKHPCAARYHAKQRAQKAHDDYRDICLKADEMLLHTSRGELT